MASAKAVLGSWMGRFIFRLAEVVDVRSLGDHFRHVSLRGEALRAARWSAGDKVQVFLPEVGMRTYTPIAWDSQNGMTSFLIYTHGDAPGAQWGRSLAIGDAVQLFGPRGSLELAHRSGRLALFGDETSFAVAKALWDLRGGRELSLLFEVSHLAECRTVIQELGLRADLVERRADDSHLLELEVRLHAARSEGATPIFTGRAQAIQRLKRSLPGPLGAPTKAYWSLGKVGLD